MRQAGFLNVVTNSYDVEAKSGDEAQRIFYQRFNSSHYDIVSVSRTYFFGCLSGISLFWLILFLVILFLNLM